MFCRHEFTGKNISNVEIEKNYISLNMFLIELNSTRLTQLSGKVSTSRTTDNPAIREHINRENEISFISFQKNNIHMCGGVRLNYKHVLSVEVCTQLFSENVNGVFALALVINEAYHIELPLNIPRTQHLTLVIVSSFTQNSCIKFKLVGPFVSYQKFLKLSNSFNDEEYILFQLKEYKESEFIAVSPLLKDCANQIESGVILGWDQVKYTTKKDTELILIVIFMELTISI